MSQLKSIALAALLGLGAAGFSGHLASAASPNPDQNSTPAKAKVYAQSDGMGRELSLMPAQDPQAKSRDANPWAVTSSGGVHIQSRAGFVGYH
jgi:hypothetical protein